MQSLIFYYFLHHQEWFIWKIFILYSSCSSTGKYSNPEKCRITPRRITPHNEMALAFKVCVCRHSFCWLLINFSFRFTGYLDLWYSPMRFSVWRCLKDDTGLSWLPSTLPLVSLLLAWHLPHTKLPISLINDQLRHVFCQLNFLLNFSSLPFGIPIHANKIPLLVSGSQQQQNIKLSPLSLQVSDHNIDPLLTL